jgi:hypothetical protein
LEKHQAEHGQQARDTPAELQSWIKHPSRLSSGPLELFIRRTHVRTLNARCQGQFRASLIVSVRVAGVEARGLGDASYGPILTFVLLTVVPTVAGALRSLAP